MLGWPALYHYNYMLFTICPFNRMADCLNSKAWRADALDISTRQARLIRWNGFSFSLHQWSFLPLKLIGKTFWELFPMQLMLLSATTHDPFGVGWKCCFFSCYRDQNWTPALAAVSPACHHTLHSHTKYVWQGHHTFLSPIPTFLGEEHCHIPQKAPHMLLKENNHH